MTPPHFQIDNEVRIIGPSCIGNKNHIGDKFKISEILERADECQYSTCNLGWYPASSLRLVEELQVDDWVKVIGPAVNYPGEIGLIFQIKTAFNSPTYGKWFSTGGVGCYPPTSLRKLTPDEIAVYQASQMLPKSTETQELRRRIHDLEMSLNGFTNGPEPEYVSGIAHVKDPVRDRLVAIESRLNELGPSHAELLGDVEALAEKVGSIQKRQENHGNRLNDQAVNMKFIKERLSVLEGEKPEVCDPTLTDLGDIAAIASFGPIPECVKAFIRHEKEEAERRKLAELQEDTPEPCHRNPKRNCALKNVVNRMDCAICEEVAQKMLDSMKET